MPTASLPQKLTSFHARHYALTRRRPCDLAPKRQAVEEWCVHAFTHTGTYSDKSSRYALVPHDVVAENMSPPGLLARYE
jgi:type III restriction enzyme